MGDSYIHFEFTSENNFDKKWLLIQIVIRLSMQSYENVKDLEQEKGKKIDEEHLLWTVSLETFSDIDKVTMASLSMRWKHCIAFN